MIWLLNAATGEPSQIRDTDHLENTSQSLSRGSALLTHPIQTDIDSALRQRPLPSEGQDTFDPYFASKTFVQTGEAHRE